MAGITRSNIERRATIIHHSVEVTHGVASIEDTTAA